MGKVKQQEGQVYSTALDGAHAAADRRALLCETKQFSFPTGETVGRKKKSNGQKPHGNTAVKVFGLSPEPGLFYSLFGAGEGGEQHQGGSVGVWGEGPGSAQHGTVG